MTNFDKLKELQDNGLVYGIGVSLISGEINDDVIHHMRLLKNIVLHAIVGILTEKDISKLKNKGIKILLLGYKNLKRGVTYMESNSHVGRCGLLSRLGLHRHSPSLQCPHCLTSTQP